MNPLQETKSALDIEVCHKGVIQGVDPPADDDHDCSDDSLHECVLKVIADRDVKSSRL